jgi:hypothetical protein
MAGTRAQEYRPEIIELIRKKLASLPEVMPMELARRQVVRGLSKQIVALAKRGYSMKAIALVISGEGVAVTGATLRGCLRGSTSNRRGVRRKRSRSASGDARVNDAATPRMMQWERERNDSVNAVQDTVVTNAEDVRDKSVDADVGVNRTRRRSNVEEREYARGASGNPAGNQAGARGGWLGNRALMLPETRKRRLRSIERTQRGVDGKQKPEVIEGSTNLRRRSPSSMRT